MSRTTASYHFAKKTALSVHQENNKTTWSWAHDKHH